MKIGIIGAMQVEIEVLIQNLSDKQVKKIGDFTFYEGKIDQVDVIVLLSGIGKVSAAAGATLLIELYKPNFVINTGTAGGLSNAEIHNIVLAEEVAYHDVDLTGFGYQLGQQAQMPPTFKADKNGLILAKKVCEEYQQKTLCGLIVSGDSFINDPNRLQQISTNFPKALAVEMEAAAISQVCHLFNIPFLVLRAISDKAGEGDTKSYDTFVKSAGKLSANININLIKKISKS